MKSSILFCLALLLSALPAQAQSSEVDRAARLARTGHRGEAIELLRSSELDARGHFLLAGLLAEERKLGRVCHSDAYASSILEQLDLAIASDPGARKRALADGRFTIVHDTLGWQALLGRSPSRDADVGALLERVTFFGPPQGIYGPTASLDFRPGGRVTGWESVWDDRADTARRASLSGTYSVQGRKVTVTLGKGKVWRGELGKDGQLVIEGRGAFTDDPGECDA